MSTELTTAPVYSVAPADPFADPTVAENFAVMARRFANSQLVPQHLRGKPDDCFVALMLAREMGESPIMVMQSIYFISGKAGWSASYMIARANRSRVFRRNIGWRVEGTGADLVVTAHTVTADGEEVAVSVSMAMAKAEGWTSNKKYQTMPELMLRYRSATMLVRLYAPEVLLGYHTSDELEDVRAASLPVPPRATRAAGAVLDVEAEIVPPTPAPWPPEGLTVEQVDVWRASHGKSPSGDLADEQRTVLATWFAADATRADLVRAACGREPGEEG